MEHCKNAEKIRRLLWKCKSLSPRFLIAPVLAVFCLLCSEGTAATIALEGDFEVHDFYDPTIARIAFRAGWEEAVWQELNPTDGPYYQMHSTVTNGYLDYYPTGGGEATRYPASATLLLMNDVLRLPGWFTRREGGYLILILRLSAPNIYAEPNPVTVYMTDEGTNYLSDVLASGVLRGGIADYLTEARIGNPGPIVSSGLNSLTISQTGRILVPEPSGPGLVLSAFVGCILMRRRGTQRIVN